jgi:uncharacterized protein YozE (UPF0346 family)
MAVNNHKTELKGKDKFLSNLSTFLVKNKVILLVLLAAAAAAIVVVAIIDNVSERNANIAAESVELIQDKYTQWLSAEEDADKTALEAEIIAGADELEADYSSTFAAQRAVYIKGNISFQKEEWTMASELFIESAVHNTDSYLAPISLMLAAAAYENNAEYAKALGVYNDIYDSYDKIFPDIPRVMLSIGRLNEQTEDTTAAIDSYNSIIDNYPGSGWASFARTRLIQMGE